MSMAKWRRIVDIYLYIAIFLFIYLEWGYAAVIGGSVTGTMKTLLMILLILPMLLFKTYHFYIKSSFLLLFLSFVMFLSSFRDLNLGNTILLFVPLLCGYVFTSAIRFDKAVKVFCDVMFFLSGTSLIVYFISIVLPSFIKRFPVMPNIHGTSVYDLYISVSTPDVSFIRNYGITWEPGAFALLLCLCVFLQIVCFKKIDKLKLSIYVIALITTFSTMGYIVFISILFVLRKKIATTKYNMIVNSFFILFIIGVVFLLKDDSSEVHSVVFGKLSGFSLGDDNPETTQARINAVVYPWYAFCESPIIGIGYDAFKILNETVCNNVATNTIMNWFALGGVLLGGPCTYYYFKAILKCSRSLKLSILQHFVLIASFALLVSTESLLRISLIYIIIFYGCLKPSLSKNE